MKSKNPKLTDAQVLRIKAEKQMELSSEKAVKPLNEAEIKKLLHELQVHQIELEMQNEELRQANDTAEKALRKFTMLYDFAPTGYFTIDKEGIIKDLNFTAAEILGEKRFTLENTNIKFFISEDFRSIFEKFLNMVFSTRRKDSCTINLSQNNNTLRKVYIEGVVISEEHNCLLSVVDITSFKK